MSRLKTLLITFCILFPLFSLYYKSQVLDLSLIPRKAKNVWNVEMRPRWENIQSRHGEIGIPLGLPLPHSAASQKVDKLEVVGRKNRGFKAKGADSDFVNFAENELYKDLFVKFEVETRAYDYFSEKGSSLYKKNKAGPEMLSLEHLDELTLQKITQLSETLVFSSDSSMVKLKKIFFYIADEIVLQPDDKTIINVIDLSSGDHLAQAQTLVALARLNQIPSRVGFGLKILGDKKSRRSGDVKFTRFFYVETLVDGRWMPLLPDERLFGVVSESHILISRDPGQYVHFLSDRELLSLVAKPVKYDPVTSQEQLKRLGEVSPFWALFSLHRFSLSIQAIFLGLVLIPFGTILLSVSRVLIGIETFGIFMPILLTLFFLETSFVFGFSFFFLIVFVGFFQRTLLDRFHLLAVPRLSILLGIVILLYIMFAVIADSFGWLEESGKTLNYFPIVIITVFIERFSIYLIEEGVENTLRTTLGTFVVSTFCYFLLSYKWLKVFLFNNPEFLLLTIGINLAIGSYQGYRLFELLRFKDFGGKDPHAL